MRMSLHLSPTLVSHTCLPLWVLWAEFTLVSHLSSTLVSHSGFFGLSLHLSPTCLPHLSPTLGSLVRMYNIIENFYICLGSTTLVQSCLFLIILSPLFLTALSLGISTSPFPGGCPCTVSSRVVGRSFQIASLGGLTKHHSIQLIHLIVFGWFWFGDSACSWMPWACPWESG